MQETVKMFTAERPLLTTKDIQDEINRLDKESNEYMLGIREKKRKLEEKLLALSTDTIKRVRTNIGKIYMHTETRSENWRETVIGIIQDVSYEKIQFSKCIVFNNNNNGAYFEKHNTPFYVNFEIANFEKGFYETQATTLWGNDITRHFEIKELSKDEANSIVTEYIEIYKKVRYSIIDDEYDGYLKSILSMFNKG